MSFRNMAETVIVYFYTELSKVLPMSRTIEFYTLEN